MAVSLADGNGKGFFYMFRDSSCQGNFFGGAEELHNLNHNFAVSNVVVELIQLEPMVFLLWQFILRLVQKPIYRLFSLNYPGKLLYFRLKGIAILLQQKL